MTITIAPKFISEIPDSHLSEDAGMVTPSRWNEGSELRMATGKILGRATSGDGLVEELSSSAARSLLGVPATSDLTGAAMATSGVSSWLGVNAGGSIVRGTTQSASVIDNGATGNGVATENTFFNNVYSAYSEIFINEGLYKITPEINLTEKDVHVAVHPNARFMTAAWDMGPIVKAIGTNPVLAFDALFKTINTDYDLYEHVVGQSIFTKASTTGPVVVSLYTNCEVTTSGASGFGANIGVYMTQTGGTGVGLEIDTHVTASGTTTTALAIDSVGSYASTQAIIIQPNGPSSPFGIGLNFNNASGNNAITTEAIRFTGAGTAQRFIYSPEDMMFSSAVLETNVFIIGPSVSGYDSLLRVDASNAGVPKLSAVGSATNIGILNQTKGTGSYQFLGGDGINRLFLTGSTGNTYPKFTNGSGGVTLEAAGTDTNADVILKGKGNAGANILSADGTTKFRANNTGIGFFTTTPVAKQSISGSRGGNAALADLLTKLAATGLITDGTTA